MLGNGTKLSYKEHSGSGTTYTVMTGLQETPEWSTDPEKVEATDMDSKAKGYEFGIGDTGEKEYKFRVKEEKMTSTSQIAKMKAYELSKTVLDFKEESPDGSSITFTGQVSITLDAKKVNTLITYTMKVVLQDAETYTWATA